MQVSLGEALALPGKREGNTESLEQMVEAFQAPPKVCVIASGRHSNGLGRRATWVKPLRAGDAGRLELSVLWRRWRPTGQR